MEHTTHELSCTTSDDTTEINKTENDTELRVPLGTRDLFGNELYVRDYITKIATECFECYGGVKLETPVMECMSTICALYGEEFNKLVYKLDDDGDKLFMRYDLTLPLARFINMNGLKQFRRYQLGKSYRKDDPQISKGRFREFYQYDFDIIGDDQGTRLYEFEILDLFDNVLLRLLENTFKIKVNDRRFIIELLLHIGVPDEKINTVSATLDKLDKKSILEIQSELAEKGIGQSVINNIFAIITDINKCSTSMEMIQYFIDMGIVSVNYICEIIKLNISSRILFDPFMVRGMSYYTGMIFEAEYDNKDVMPSSIGGGGVYNKMVFAKNKILISAKNKNNESPCSAVGMSLGVERIATILIQNTKFMTDLTSKQTKFDIFIATIGKDMVIQRLKLASELRKLNYKVTMSHLENPKMRSQFNEVFELKIPLMIVLGESELVSNTVKIKEIEKSVEFTYDRTDLSSYLKSFFNK
jgi:histidyl-tRNA synthetase